jgi:hypothetical protein
MNFKKFLSLLFVMLLGMSTFAFAEGESNIGRGVYSIYSDTFNGAHFYGTDVPDTDYDGMKEHHWNQKISVRNGTSNVQEGIKYSIYNIPSNLNDWDVIAYACVRGKNGTSDTIDPRNMSQYMNEDSQSSNQGKIKFLARSSKTSAKNAYVGFQCRRTESGSVKDVLVYKTLGSLGFETDGTWQEVTIPIDKKTSYSVKVGQAGATTKTIDSSYLEKVIAYFIFQPITLSDKGDLLDIDNIRWIKYDAGTDFSVVVKKVSDNQPVADQTAPISFSEDSFGMGWTVADQYLELDIDGEIPTNNWTVRFCSSNTIAGLYNEKDPSNVLGMAWKVSCSTLPYVYTDYSDPSNPKQNINTLEIGEKKNDAGDLLGLYDQGKVDFLHDTGVEWLYPWFFVKAKGDQSEESVIWKNTVNNPSASGCHTFENTQEDGHSGYITVHFYDPLSDFFERKPKLFFACDTKNAKASKYKAGFTIILSFE